MPIGETAKVPAAKIRYNKLRKLKRAKKET